MARPTWRIVLAALALTGAQRAMAATPAVFRPSTGIRAAEVASGFDHPLFLCQAPGDPRILVVEQPGRIRWIDGARLPSGTFLDVHDVASDGGERGLLRLACRPRYATDEWL